MRTALFVCGLAAATVAAGGCGGGAADRASQVPARSGRTVDVGVPPAAVRSTARVAVASGTGARRLALWTATNARDELCLGWRLGVSTAPPASFTCQREGLVRPLLSVEGGGGAQGNLTWGTLVGVVSPRVAHVTFEITKTPVRLRPLRGFAGWRVFASGVGQRPPSDVQAVDRRSRLVVDDNGVWVASPCDKRGDCSDDELLSEPPWTDTSNNVPGTNEGDATAITLALAQPTIRRIVTGNDAWIHGVQRWSKCTGAPLGRGVEFHFGTPTTFQATFAVMRRPKGAFAYAEGIQRLLAVHVRDMTVWVDLNRRRVVGVDPADEGLGGDVLPLGAAHLHDAGGADTPGCWETHD